MSRNSSKRLANRKRANFKRKRKWSLEFLEAKRLLTGDVVNSLSAEAVSENPVMISQFGMPPGHTHACDTSSEAPSSGDEHCTAIDSTPSKPATPQEITDGNLSDIVESDRAAVLRGDASDHEEDEDVFDIDNEDDVRLEDEFDEEHEDDEHLEDELEEEDGDDDLIEDELDEEDGDDDQIEDEFEEEDGEDGQVEDEVEEEDGDDDHIEDEFEDEDGDDDQIDDELEEEDGEDGQIEDEFEEEDGEDDQVEDEFEEEDESEDGGNTGTPLSTTPLHESAIALVSDDLATHTATGSGNWSNPAIWSNSAVPSSNARIVIPQGVTMTVDSVVSPEFKSIRVDGTLRFATDRNTELRVETLVSSGTGRVEIGTEANPVQPHVTARVVFIDDGAIDRSADPAQVGRGAILMGTTEVFGAPVTHQRSLAVHPTAGTSTLSLAAAPEGWKVGDEIIITGTQGPTSEEVRTITSIQGDRLTLDSPLSQDHVPPRSDLNVYVANATRNVEFTSENTATARRGHIMFMHTNNVNVNNAKFTELGRTDKKIPLDDINFEFTDDAIGNVTSAGVDFSTSAGAGNNVRGRYPVHFHRGGTAPGSTSAVLHGSVLVGSPGYGYVNHTSNVEMTNNVSYNVHGSAFYTEAGDETGAIVNNIAIRTVNPDFRLEENGEISVDLRADVQDFGVDGDAFWLSGHLVSLKDNIASGSSGHGIIIWSDGLVEADRGRSTVRTADLPNGHLIPNRETIPVWWAPLAEISNNESSNATIGFRARYIHSSTYLGEVGSPFHEPPPQAYLDTLKPVVDGLTVWGSRDGALLNYNERLSLRNARLIGTGAPYVRQDGTTDLGVGIDMYNSVSRGPGVVENVTVEGFNMGILAPRHESWEMSNIHLRNTTDLFIKQATISSRTLDMTNVTFGDLAGTAVAGNEGQRRNVVMEGNDVGEQPYWFLMTDRVSMNGEGLYYNEQAASHVPLTPELREDSRAPVSAEFVGQTNQQLQQRYGSSFGGEITPADARSVSWLSGGVVGRLPAQGQTVPPMYEMRDPDDAFGVVSSGNLRNFDAPPVTGSAIGFGAVPDFTQDSATPTTPRTSTVSAQNLPVEISPSSPRPGDAIPDGSVDFQDFLVVARNFGATDAAFEDGDFDGDGEVSFLDFLILSRNFT